MTPEQFYSKLKENAAQIKEAFVRVLPIKVGRLAKNHFQENFEKSGFVNGGLHPWERSKRIGKSKGVAGSRKTLLGPSQHLFSSIQYQPGASKVTITNNVPYARVHNEGLRSGRGKGFIMPKRQFMGQSKELDKEVESIIIKEISSIIQ